MSSSPRFTTLETSDGFYIYDGFEERPVGDSFSTEVEADMRAFVMNRADATRRGCVERVLQERQRQDEAWGPQDELASGQWLAVLTKEIGDVSRALLHPRKPTQKELEVELTHVAAVALAWLEVLDRNR